jgi:hypothetical protein
MATEIIVVFAAGEDRGRRALLKVSENPVLREGGLHKRYERGMNEPFYQALGLAHRQAWRTLGSPVVQLPSLEWDLAKLLPGDPELGNLHGGSAYGPFAMAILQEYIDSPMVQRLLGFKDRLMKDGVRRELQTSLRAIKGSAALIRRVAVTAEGDEATGDFKPVAANGVDQKFRALADLETLPDPAQRLQACVVARGQEYPEGVLHVPVVKAYNAIDAFQRLFELGFGGLI